MKALTLTLITTLFTSVAFSQTYTFVTPGNANVKFTVQGANETEAFKSAAQECFDYLTKGRKINQEYGLTAIDVCANLRQK